MSKGKGVLSWEVVIAEVLKTQAAGYDEDSRWEGRVLKVLMGNRLAIVSRGPNCPPLVHVSARWSMRDMFARDSSKFRFRKKEDILT